jgi:hypothetical protein
MNYDPRKAIRQAMMIARREVTAPNKASIKGQRHILAYITPYEAELLMRRGGSGRLTEYGVPAFDDGDGDGDGPGGGDTSNADPGTQSAGAGNEGTGAGPTGAGIGGIGQDSQDDVGGPPGPPGGPNSGFGSSMNQDPENTQAAANMNTAVSAQQQGYGVGIADTGGVAPTGFGAAPGIAEAFDAYDKGIIGLNQALGYAALSAFSPPGLEFGQVTDEVGNQAVGGRGNIGGAIGGIAGMASGVPGAGTVGGMIGSQVADALGVPSHTFSFADGGAVDGDDKHHEIEAKHFADGGEVLDEPQKTVKAYKLFRTKKSSPGQLFPLYVNANKPVPIGQWIAAEEGPMRDGKVKSSLGNLAYRPGWHAGDLPMATHIGNKSSPDKTKPDYRPDEHVWAEVEMPADVDWQSVADQRAKRTKSGAIDPKTAHITDQIPYGGFYRYKTNPNMTGNWLISGGLKVNRVLSDDEVKEINDQAGVADLPRLRDLKTSDGYADGGEITPPRDLGADPTVQQALNVTRQVQPTAPQMAATVQPQAQPAPLKTTKYKSWADVPTINPQDLVGKRVFPIFADLTKAGSAFTGIDASQLAAPEQLYGGPGYPLLPESQKEGLAWAVEGKGRGSAKIRKDADYVVVSSMMPHSHQSNASFSNALMKNMDAYVRDKRLAPEALSQIDDMIRRPTEQADLQGLQDFPGFAHPEAENFLRGITFEQRKRISNVLASKEAQNLGAPNIDKITRETLDPEFSGVPSRHGMFLLEIPKGTEDQQLVNLKEAGLPEHPSYQYGIKGRIVGKFHHPVAPEILFKDWFDKANEEAKGKEKSNIRRAFDLAMPVTTVTQEVADMLPRHPRDIQSGKAARLALNAFNDQWMHTDDAVNKGGLGAADFSQALKNSDFSSTLSQYSADDINKMKKDKNFTGYKLKDGEIYFGLKRNTNYADDYGFEHPELTPNETALVSVVNNEPGAKGVGGAPVVLKAIQEGATALDCYAVPSQKHPKGFLPSFYSHFGFKELGRIPFDPQYVTQAQFDDMKHQWRKSGWDESMGLPSLVVMKWDGKDEDRSDAVRRFVSQSSESVGPQSGGRDVQGTSRALKQGARSASGRSRVSGQGDTSGDRGAVRTDRNARPADRFTRTLSEVSSLSPEEARHFGLDPAEVEALRGQFPQKAFGGSTVDKALRLTAPARPMVALADLFQRQLRGR